MNYDLNQAFTYIFKNKQEMLKILVLIAAMIVALVPIIGPIVSGLFLQGYFFCNMNRRIFKPNEPAQEWNDFSKIFLTGLKAFGFSFVLTLVLALPITCVYLPLINAYKTGANVGNVFVSMIVALIVLTVVCMYAFAAMCVFATNLKFSSFFKFGAIKFLIVDKFVEMCVISLITFLIFIAAAVIVGITFGIAGFIMVPYLYFVMGDLQAQYIRKVFKIGVKN